MEDNEIIKALECCRNGLCTDCPRLNTPAHILLCKEQLMCETLDLINRQKAEIEKLKKGYFEVEEAVIKTAKTEAIKEFAERLKDIPRKHLLLRPDSYYKQYIRVTEIDNLVKEMVGE